MRERGEFGKVLKREVCEIFKRFARYNGLIIKFSRACLGKDERFNSQQLVAHV